MGAIMEENHYGVRWLFDPLPFFHFDNIEKGTDLIASSFSKISSGDNIKKIDKKDISKALLIFYGVTYAQVASKVSLGEKTSKNIISGDAFESLELMQMIQNCFCTFNGNTIEAIFNDY